MNTNDTETSDAADAILAQPVSRYVLRALAWPYILLTQRPRVGI